MDYKVYRTRVVINRQGVDMDHCPIWEDETIYEDVFSSKREAVRMAQSKFAKQPLNRYVRSVWSYVSPLIISDKGMERRPRCYNMFKVIG